MRSFVPATLFAAALALGSTGCIKSMILNSTIKSTRIGAGASDTIGDYELARSASQAAMMQFEGMHRLAPDNTDALYMLMRGWAGYGYAFASDDYEVADLAGDEATAEYHKRRAKLAFDRSIAYGEELISKKAEGFKDAKKNADTIKTWLATNFKEADDAENLFWFGSAWLARVKDAPYEASVDRACRRAGPDRCDGRTGSCARRDPSARSGADGDPESVRSRVAGTVGSDRRRVQVRVSHVLRARGEGHPHRRGSTP